MRGRAVAEVAAILVAFAPIVDQDAFARGVPAPSVLRPTPRLSLRGARLRFHLFPRRPRILPIPPLPDLPLQTPDQIPPPDFAVPSAPEGTQAEPSFLPQGFTLTVAMGPGPIPPPPSPLTRYPQVATALGACWRPPAASDDANWTDITMRVSFRRNGSVNGTPRIPYVGAGTAQAKADLAESLLGALRACVPLPFSPSLGSAIAGEIYAIRFTNRTTR